MSDQNEKILKARKKRIALAANKNKMQSKKDNSREDFRKYFLKINKKLKIEKYLEEAIWIHLETIGCNKKELFEQGVKHFGYNI